MSDENTPVAEEADPKPTTDFVDEPQSDSGSGMGLRLGIMLGLFVVLAAGILGYQYYLNSQLPKEDPQYIREKAPEGANTPTGAMPQAPEA